jgi:PAS domain S-box-containing protein
MEKNRDKAGFNKTAPKFRAAKYASREEFAGIASVAPIGVCIAAHGTFVYVNPKCEDIAGCSKEELLAADSLSHVHPDDRAKVRENTAKALKGAAFHMNSA